MNRHSKKKSYTQFLQKAAEEERQRMLDEKFQQRQIETIVGGKGENCNDACQKHSTSSSCLDELLTSPKYLQSCDIVEKFLGEEECKSSSLRAQNHRRNNNNNNKNDHENVCQDFNGRIVPSSFQPDSSSCSYNTMLNPFVVPLCNATPTNSKTRRICVCFTSSGISSRQQHDDIVPDEEEKRNAKNQEENENEKDQEEKDDDSQNSEKGEDDGEHDDDDQQQNKPLCSIVSSSHHQHHQDEIHKGCLVRLKDSKHLGSWSLLTSATARSNNDQNQHQQHEIDDEEEKLNKKKSSAALHHHHHQQQHQQQLPILSRHHDGFYETFWFPQKTIPYGLEKILFAHLIGRILHFDWVPATTILELPLKKAPKLLNNKLQLHHKNHHHHKKEEDEEGNDDEELVKNSKQRVLEEVVDYLTPDGSCPDVFLGKGQQQQQDEWMVRVVVSAHHNNNNNNNNNNNIIQQHSTDEKVHDDEKGEQEETTTSEFAEQQLFDFLLGVHKEKKKKKSGESSSSSLSSWEEIIQNMDDSEMKKNHVITRQVPKCLLLRNIVTFKKQELFEKRIVNASLFVNQFHQQQEEKEKEKDSIIDDDDDNDTKNKKERKERRRIVRATSEPIPVSKNSLELLKEFVQSLLLLLQPHQETKSSLDRKKNQDNNKKSLLMEVLASNFGLDVEKWKFDQDDILEIFSQSLTIENKRKKKALHEEDDDDNQDKEGRGSTEDKSEFFYFLHNIHQRLETLLSMISRCKLL